jgi:secondary thiamine-phosphate synthase enzyme
MRCEIEVESRSRAELLDITSLVQDCVKRGGVTEGMCVVFVPHTTAAVTCNENWDTSVQSDILEALERLVPWRLAGTTGPGYAHDEGNSAAHIKASLLGASQTLLVTGGRLALGTWQGLYLAEFDGPRRRRILVRIMNDSE